ncbi:hypothetical protein [Acinetobacter sp.]|uniref:hypothetical protein n=1 Tax=Acinetobacter sp. TaxID=472 RepID=UPI003CFCF80D
MTMKHKYSMLDVISHPIKMYKQNKKAKEEAERKRLKADEREKVRDYKQYRQRMLNSPCAINGFSNCNEKCVHFKEGGIGFCDRFKDYWPAGYYVVKPSCKLWTTK